MPSNQVTNNQLTRSVFRISGMDCTACALNIDLDLEELPGVKKSQTNYAKSETVVEFDPIQTSIAQISESISKTGYVVKQ